MGWHGSYKARKFEVGERLLALRTRTKLTQAELATLVGASRRTVQSWEAGAAYPQEDKLQQLISVFLSEGAWTAGQEYLEAASLWQQVSQDAPRRLARFDETWFAELLAKYAVREPQATAAETLNLSSGSNLSSLNLASPDELVASVLDWGEAPDVPALYGRDAEMAIMQRWIIEDRCRVVALLGLGGIGKTSLAVTFVRAVAAQFDLVLFRSLHNAPPLGPLLDELIRAVSAQRVTPPQDSAEKIAQLIQLFREHRCLLILDNFESVIQEQSASSGKPSALAEYGLLIQRLGQGMHQACLLLTSREKPPELGPLEGRTSPVRTLVLSGLAEDACEIILKEKEIYGVAGEYEALVALYGGNPLALQLISEPIRELFGGQIGTFLSSGDAFFNGVGKLLDQQFSRSTSVESSILTWLAIEREPVALETIAANMAGAATARAVFTALDHLRHRFLIERGADGFSFTLQPVIMEYVTDRLVREAFDGVMSGEANILCSHALVKATAKDYVRQSQERLIALPLAEQLTDYCGRVEAVVERLLVLLERWRKLAHVQQGYGPGNVVNLLRVLRKDLKGFNFSHLLIREAYLQEIEMQDTSLVSAHINQSVLYGAFTYALCLAFSSNGAFLAAGTMDGMLNVWRVASRTLILSVKVHAGAVYGIAFNNDGRLLVTSSIDGTARLWNPETGVCLAILKGHAGALRSVAISGNGQLVATGGVDGTVRLWRVSDEQCLTVLEGHNSEVHGVAISADGGIVASASVDGIVRIWDTSSYACRAVLEGHTALIWSIALSLDGNIAASGSYDGTVRLWSTQEHRLLAVLQGHNGAVRGVALTADGALAVSSSVDGTVRLWHTASGTCQAVLQGHQAGVVDVTVTADGQLIASGSLDGTVRLWETSNRACLAVLQGHTNAHMGLALSHDEQTLVSGSFDGKLRLWRAQDGHLLATLPAHASCICGVAINADGRLLASCSFDETVKLWSVPQRQLILTIEAPKEAIRCLAMSADGQIMASGSSDGVVRLWETTSGRCLQTLQGHTGGTFGMAITADGGLVASGSLDGTVKLWLTSTGECWATLSAHAKGVYAVALSGDGQWLASAGLDGTIGVWSVVKQQLLASWNGHATPVHCIAISANGQWVASGGLGGTVKLWKVQNGRAVATIAHEGVVWRLALSADGQWGYSAGEDGTLRLFSQEQPTSPLRTLHLDRPYERVDISGVTGITDAQRLSLIALGAVEQRE
jgi:WD40 repeat protein/transcriptional regulator with XRE-family HTH domain